MPEFRNIVIVGGSSAGLGVAHSFLKHTYPSLKSKQPDIKYKVHIIEPSTHFWWKICAPRACVSTADFPHEKAFLSIADGLKPYDSNDYELHQAVATGVDTAKRTVTFAPTSSGQSETITYYALVIATGASTPTRMTSLHGSHENSIAALDKMNKRLPTATSVIIGGGGPVAVETAGEIGEKLNGAAGWFKSRPDAPKAKITIITGGSKLLPALSQGTSSKAEKLLNRVGVDVIYNTRIERADLSAADREIIGDEEQFGASASKKSVVYLSNGETMEADVYIPAIGTKPNTSFLPKHLLNDKGQVKTNKQLRVEDAGPRVYCAGDVGDYTTGGMMSLYNAVPVLSTNLANDLAKGDMNGASGESKIKDKDMGPNATQTQMVPVGRSKGVAQFSGNSLPSFAVWAVKGRDYMIWGAKQMQAGTKW